MDPELVKKVQLLIGKHQESVNVKIVKEGFKCENISKMWMGKKFKEYSFICMFVFTYLPCLVYDCLGGRDKEGHGQVERLK